MKNIKAVTIGDIDGIGIKLLINLWKKRRKKIGNIILVSNFYIFQNFLKKNNIILPIYKINNFSKLDQIRKDKLPIFDIKAKNNISNTYKSLIVGFNLAKTKKCRALITLPINKEKIIKTLDKKFIGQTEFFQKLDRKKYSNMIFYSKKIIITSLTTHVPLKKISSIIKNKISIYKKILLINESLIKDLHILNPKIVICGINPHAGENGFLGKEEKNYLLPVIKKLNQNGINIKGPFSADSIFRSVNRNKYNCFIAIYHDQALIPFKIISEFEGVNFTGSLNIIRTSPQHGTAYDLLNIKKANNKSLLNSFLLAEKIYKNRSRYKIASS